MPTQCQHVCHRDMETQYTDKLTSQTSHFHGSSKSLYISGKQKVKGILRGSHTVVVHSLRKITLTKFKNFSTFFFHVYMVRWLGYGLAHQKIGFRFPVGKENISSSKRPNRSAYPVQMEAGFPEVNLSGRGADHSPPSSVDVYNSWRYTSGPSYAFIVWCFIKHKHTFILVSSFLRYYVQIRYKLDQWMFQKLCNIPILFLLHLIL
jgi:hypothetical protein